MRTRHVWWWHCARCGITTMQRDTFREAEVDQAGHLRECPGRRAPWELHISDTDITEF